MARLARVEDEITLSLADYTVACICPLGVECAAVEAMLDEIHDPLPTSSDRNAYIFGRLGVHNVVVAVMPEMGNNAAATTATQLLNDFPSLRFGLLVGVGAGVPDSETGDDVRLGDIVVGQPTDTFGGVVQYDIGKKVSDGNFLRIGHLNKPPEVLSGNVRKLQAQHHRISCNISSYMAEMMQRYPKMKRNYQHPGLEQDNLFRSDYAHQGGSTCENCERGQTVSRSLRRNTEPKIFYGTIGSANVVVKDPVVRDRLKKDMGVICLEMEAAGLMNTFPCLVVRGICDYADSHKNKRWQPYAATTAAAYMKELLMIIPAQQVKETVNARECTKAVLDAFLGAVEEPVRKTEIKVQQIHTRQEENRESEILSWVSETPYEKHFKTAKHGLLADSGRWLFEKPEFAKWLQSNQSELFWLRGKPGSGKTKLCAMVVDTLIKQDANVIYFFCSRSLNGPDRQDPKSILRSLLHQLSSKPQDGVPKLIRDAFEKRYSTGMARDGLDFDESREMIGALLKDHPSITIVIDALDECNEQKRSALLQFIRHFVDDSTTSVRVLISSRDDRDIVVRLKDMPNFTINESVTRTDIERFVEQQVKQSVQSKELLYGEATPELESKIIAELVAKAGGMFLWVRLQVQRLCQMQTENQVLSLLGRLPPTLSETYDRIYEKIEQSPSAHEAHKALAWLMGARGPLRPTQWASGTSWAVNKTQVLGDRKPSHLSAETLLGMCQNLVGYDELQNHIVYTHISVLEYLEKKPQFSKLYLDTLAAETCLRFMIKTRLPRPSDLEYDLYKYSARHWISHVKASGRSVPSELDDFLGRWEAPTMAYREWKGAVELFGRRHREYNYADEIATLTNGLLLAAYYGIRHTALWKRSRYDPNATDERGMSLLALASQNGQQRIIELLVRNGATVNPARRPIDSSTAMCAFKTLYSYAGHFHVDDCHPLFLAIQGGHPEAVQTLLDCGAIFHDRHVLEVAARCGPPSVLFHILEGEPASQISTKTLVMAAMNETHPQILQACLGACQSSSITGEVLEAILDHRTDRMDIVTRLLAPRITASVLRGIWRRKRLAILGRLLEWVPDLSVSEDVVEQLALDTPIRNDCVVEVLRSLVPGASITSRTLEAVFRVKPGAVKLLKVLLNSKNCRTSTTDAKPNKINVEIASLEPLVDLFNDNIDICLTEKLILAAMSNPEETLSLLELLLSIDPFIPITEEVVTAVPLKKNIIELLLSKSRYIATGNKRSSKVLLQLQEKLRAIDSPKPPLSEQTSSSSTIPEKPSPKNPRSAVFEIRATAMAGQETWFRSCFSSASEYLTNDQYGSIFLAAIEGGDPGIIRRCIDYGGIWPGTDEHGWNAELMAFYKCNKSLLSQIRAEIGWKHTSPLPASAWAEDGYSESSPVRSNERILRLTSSEQDKARHCVRANHPFIPSGTSYFEVKIRELKEPEYKNEQWIQERVEIGVIDELLRYRPAFYSDTGYVHDLFLTWEVGCYKEGDTVGYGIDWKRKQQFVTVNGVREDVHMSFDQLHGRRLFPSVRVFGMSGNCELEANFQGPFVYRLLQEHGVGW